MFGKLKNLFGGDSGIEITAPVAGKVVALEDVPDPTFAQGILGPGIAIEPAEGRIVAPADGTVDVMFETGHAVSLTTADGAELLIHVGIDTVQLEGKHYKACCKAGQQVKKGERLYRLGGGETVEADIAGEVTGLYVEQGGVVTAGETTAQIIDMNSLEIELNVDEYDVAAVVPGQVVQVNVLAPDVSFTGSVTALNKNGTASGDLSYYTATVAFDAAENVYPGMQVSAKVLKEQAEDAVLLRQDAVQFDDYNKPYVLVRGTDGKSVEQKSVTVGVSDGMNCEITSGLNAGDTVLKSSGVTMAELMEQMHAQQRTGR